VASKPDSTSHAEVYSITAARRPHQADVNERMLKYLVSMSIRTICFVLVLVTPSPWRWFFAVGAIVLPYIAVIIANAGRERRGPAPQGLTPPPAAPEHLSLGSAPVVLSTTVTPPSPPRPPAGATAVAAAAGSGPAGHPR